MTPCSLVRDIGALKKHTASTFRAEIKHVAKMAGYAEGGKTGHTKVLNQNHENQKGEEGANRDQWQQYVLNRKSTLGQKERHSYFYFIKNAQNHKSHSHKIHHYSERQKSSLQ
jgi:hypothetical protein